MKDHLLACPGFPTSSFTSKQRKAQPVTVPFQRFMSLDYGTSQYISTGHEEHISEQSLFQTETEQMQQVTLSRKNSCTKVIFPHFWEYHLLFWLVCQITGYTYPLQAGKGSRLCSFNITKLIQFCTCHWIFFFFLRENKGRKNTW